MVKYGMTPLAALQADLLNGAKLLGWQGQIGELNPGYLADVIAVPGDPSQDITRARKSKLRHEGGCGLSKITSKALNGSISKPTTPAEVNCRLQPYSDRPSTCRKISISISRRDCRISWIS
jgi:hypothetical protein